MLDKYKFWQKKDLNNIPLVHVHTFESGEELYTYDSKNKNHYKTIASRYWESLNRSLNWLKMYGQEESQVKKFFDMLLEKNKNIIAGINVMDNALAINTLVEFQKSYVYNKTALELKHMELLFCMFYLLKEEINGGYSDFYNEKKLRLINGDAMYRDVFFSSVQTIADDLGIILNQSTEEFIAQATILANQKLNTLTTLSENG